MAEVVVFHHALGLTPGVLAFAAGFRAGGHEVHTPDLFEGRTFETIEAGAEHARKLGFDELVERGARAVEALPPEIVYCGLSLGVLPAQKLAQTRTGARGALLLYACAPVSEFGDAWPTGVPVQVHAKEDDPYFAEDAAAADTLVSDAAEAQLFLYPGDEHLFADETLRSYDPDAAALLWRRVTAFLAAA
jgi:dienelactone hydrolase